MSDNPRIECRRGELEKAGIQITRWMWVGPLERRVALPSKNVSLVE